MKTISTPGLVMTVRDEWENITDGIASERKPFTFADPQNGVGALQISPALYCGGESPKVSLNNLAELLHEFAITRELGDPHDSSTIDGLVFGVASSFHTEDDLIRVWYVSDGRNIALITYVCDWENRSIEPVACEEAVKSIRFM